jgi:hypothetical protein
LKPETYWPKAPKRGADAFWTALLTPVKGKICPFANLSFTSLLNDKADGLRAGKSEASRWNRQPASFQPNGLIRLSVALKPLCEAGSFRKTGLFQMVRAKFLILASALAIPKYNLLTILGHASDSIPGWFGAGRLGQQRSGRLAIAAAAKGDEACEFC